MFSRVLQILEEVCTGKIDRLLIRKVYGHVRNIFLPRLFGYLVLLGPILQSLSLKPLGLTFEVTNICNANCVFCGYQYIKRSKGVMKMDVFQKALNDFVSIGGGNLGLNAIVGEPLVDPDLLEKIRYARLLKNIGKIGFYTNGILLHKLGFREILTSGISDITISFGGPDKERYERLYRVDGFEQTIRNLLLLGKANNKLGQPVKISVVIRCDGPFRPPEKLREIGAIVHNMIYSYRYDNWAGRITQADLLTGMRLKQPKLKWEPCSEFYAYGPTVLWNGDVVICGCRDLEGELALGNIMEEDLVSLWQGDKMRKFREEFFQGKIPDICRDCGHYNSVKILRTLTFRTLAKENWKAFKKSDYYTSLR